MPISVNGRRRARRATRTTATTAVFSVLRSVQQVGEVIWFSLQLRRVPGELLGRVSSLDFVVWNGLMPASFAISGPLVEIIGAQATFIGGGILGGRAHLATYLGLPGRRERVP
jgi:hypothetical protein